MELNMKMAWWHKMAKVFSKVVVTDGCWYWCGRIDNYGYAYHHRVRVSRYMYRIFVGPIPEDLELDHLCRNRACVNPKHLEAVSSRENTFRGIAPSSLNAKKTHCPKGHPYSGSNLYIFVNKGKTSRKCKACDLANSRSRWEILKARNKQMV